MAGTALLRAALRAAVVLVAATRCRAMDTIIIGGSSGMGKAAAKACLRAGGRVLLASRDRSRLAAARREILHECPSPKKAGFSDSHAMLLDEASKVRTVVLDARDEAAMADFAKTLDDGEYEGLVVSAAGRAPHGAVADLDVARTREIFDSKFWSAYHAAKHVAPKLRDGGAVCFVAGVLNRRPGVNSAPLACVNGALEGLTRSLALDLGPRLRVNCLSPGFADTERFDHMDAEKKARMLANTADSLHLKRHGTPADMGAAIHYLLTAAFVTGVVLDVDGGHTIRQYANPQTDPMRSPS